MGYLPSSPSDLAPENSSRRRECELEKKGPRTALFVSFSCCGPLWFMAAVGQSGLFTLFSKAERSTGRQEGSRAILHGHIV